MSTGRLLRTCSTWSRPPSKRSEGSLSSSVSFTLDEFKQAIQSGPAELNQLIGKFNPSRIVQAIQNAVKAVLSPLEKLEALKAQVETIVRGALGTVSDAIKKINIKPLVDTVKQALAKLSDALKTIADLIKEVRDTIQTALDAVETGLKA